jgi:hypothetical protein
VASPDAAEPWVHCRKLRARAFLLGMPMYYFDFVEILSVRERRANLVQSLD